MITLKLRTDRTGPVAGFHPWIFSGAISNIPKNLVPGDPVRLENSKGDFLASGYFNGKSNTIAVKVWGFDPEEKVDENFFLKRIERAYTLRKKFIKNNNTDSYRLIHGESDLLPGFTADKYASYICVQFHTKAIERWKNDIINALTRVMNPIGIYERSDSHARKTDGLIEARNLIFGSIPELVMIRENNLNFLVDINEGQKTGFFLDQRDKRMAIMKYSHNSTVLNCFCYTGGFSIYALAAGAKKITNVDSSERALYIAQENVKINRLDDDKCKYICADAKKYLKQEVESDNKFDMVILDPPAFIKDRNKKKEGISGYKFINEKGMELVNNSGILVTCSCSVYLSMQDLRYLLSESGAKTRKPFAVIEEFFHGIDHPSLLPFTEGEYLKCIIMNAIQL
jgi:23S rRNA (cytosine1962-C5)-methyltransferase